MTTETILFFTSSPLEQFELYNVFFGLNNLEIFFGVVLSFTILWWHSFYSSAKMYRASNWYNLLLFVQEQLMVLVARNIGVAGQVYYPFLTSLFLCLLVTNLVGIVPYAFTLTSQIMVTLAFSFTFFFGTNLRLLVDSTWKFFNLFLPSGAPLAISPFLVLVETISYFARVASLAIRLFANIMAGHSLLKILIGFAYLLFSYSLLGGIIGWIPWFLVFLITFLETGVALIQAYVFTILSCVYIKDLYVSH